MIIKNKYIVNKFNTDLHKPCSEDRLYFYLWSEKDTPNETKHGQTWVYANIHPVEQCNSRIFNSLSVRKDKARDDKSIICNYIIDVTEYAKKDGYFNIKAKYDDFIRNKIGFRKGSRGEVHILPPKEYYEKLLKLFSTYTNNKKPEAGLSTYQYINVAKTLGNIKNNRIVLSDLCARFGKTIYSSATMTELNSDLTVVASYVQTVFSSFNNDLRTFKQWNDYVIVDHDDDNWYSITKDALKNKKKVVVFLSLCSSPKRDKKIKKLLNMGKNPLLVVDEADFGAWTPKQSLPLIEQFKYNKKLKVVLMTGTNSDRAVSLWTEDNIGESLSMVSTGYFELLTIKKYLKKQKEELFKSMNIKHSLKYFSWNPSRDDLIPDIELYYMDMISTIERAKEIGKVDEDMTKSPSWTKLCHCPEKNQALLTEILENIFKGTSLELSERYQLGNASQVSLIFMNTKSNKELNTIGRMSKDILSGFNIITLSGDERINGKKVKQENVEKLVLEKLEQAKKDGNRVIIISNRMAQRSFSIPELETVYLAYDRGEEGTTLQKLSRCLTPKDLNKIGKVISLSFDHNRDDKFDAIYIETAISMHKKNPKKSVKEHLEDILGSVRVRLCTAEKGALPIEPDHYLERLMKNTKTMSRVIGKVISDDVFNKMSLELKNRLINSGKSPTDGEKLPSLKIPLKNKKIKRGKTSKNPNRTDEVREKEKIRRTLAVIVETIPSMMHAYVCQDIKKTIELAKKDKQAHEFIKKQMGISYDNLKEIIKNDYINKDYINLLYNQISKVESIPVFMNKISKDFFKLNNKETVFLPEYGSGNTQYAGSLPNDIIKKLKENGWKDKDIKKKVLGYDNTFLGRVSISQNNLCTFSNTLNMDKKDIMKNKFNLILLNSPYDTIEYIKNFNENFDRLTDNCKMTVIQPSRQVYFQSKQNYELVKKFRDIIQENHTEIEFAPGRETFTNVFIDMDLAIITITKKPNSSKKIKKVKYKNGEEFKNVSLDNINHLEINPEKIGNIKKKVQSKIASKGSLSDIYYSSKEKPRNKIAGIPPIRGNMGANDYSFFPKNMKSKYLTKNIKEKACYGIPVENDKQLNNFYDLCKTNIIRFLLAMGKPYLHIGKSNLRFIPILDLNTSWNDIKLKNHFSFTEEEIKTIEGFIKPYYD